MTDIWTIDKIEVFVLKNSPTEFRISSYNVYYTGLITATVIKAFDGTNTYSTEEGAILIDYVDYQYGYTFEPIFKPSVIEAVTFNYFTMHDLNGTEIARFTINISGNTSNTLNSQGDDPENGNLFIVTSNSSQTADYLPFTFSVPVGSSTLPVSMCLLKGTLILTPSGQQLIETLKANDEIITSDGVTHKIKYMHHEHSVSETMLYVIRKNAVSENVPFEDLYLSGGHAVLIGGKLYHPEHHRNNKIFEKIVGTSICEFYHIALDVYFDTYLVANGLPAELVGYEFKDEHTWNCVNDDHCTMIVKKN
jgi:hypothetical protein